MPGLSLHMGLNGEAGDKEEKRERALGIGTTGTGGQQPLALSLHQAPTQSQIEVDINVTCWPPRPCLTRSPSELYHRSGKLQEPIHSPRQPFLTIIFSPRLNFLECHSEYVYTVNSRLKNHFLLVDKVQVPSAWLKKCPL